MISLNEQVTDSRTKGPKRTLAAFIAGRGLLSRDESLREHALITALTLEKDETGGQMDRRDKTVTVRLTLWTRPP